jgi:hypothetical protein
MNYLTEVETMNPLVPSALDGVLTAVSLAALILVVVAFISLVCAAPRDGRRLLAWGLVVLLVPFIGPAAWIVARRRERSIDRKTDAFRS